jgi:hypothetical protein
MKNRNYYIGTAISDSLSTKTPYKRGEKFLFDCAVAKQGITVAYICRLTPGVEYDQEAKMVFDYRNIKIDVETPENPTYIPMGVRTNADRSFCTH